MEINTWVNEWMNEHKIKWPSISKCITYLKLQTWIWNH
jgi:hypothetical protein